MNLSLTETDTQKIYFISDLHYSHDPPFIWGKRGYSNVDEMYVGEASGYIPSEKQKNDPRFSTALTVDVKPDSIKKNAKAFYWNTSRAGIPPTAKPSGKI
jgi:hypothetical protein